MNTGTDSPWTVFQAPCRLPPPERGTDRVTDNDPQTAKEQGDGQRKREMNVVRVTRNMLT